MTAALLVSVDFEGTKLLMSAAHSLAAGSRQVWYDVGKVSQPADMWLTKQWTPVC